MKAARFVMRGAGTLSRAGLVPREVDHFSRYSPSPLSMKQLLDFGERGRRAGWGAGAGELPELQVPVQGGMGSLLKNNWGPLSCRTLEPPRQRPLRVPAPGVFRTVCALCSQVQATCSSAIAGWFELIFPVQSLRQNTFCFQSTFNNELET